MEHKKREIWALIILTATILVGCSLVSFNPADPTFFGSTTAQKPPHNWVGALGANLAWCLLFVLGVGAYALPAVGLWLGYAFLRGRNPLPYGRIQVLGLILLVLSLIGLASLHAAKITFLGTQVLPGGQLGALMAAFLRARVNDLGAHILMGALFLIALILSTPFSLRAAGRLLFNALRWLGAQMASLVPRMRERKARSKATAPKAQRVKPRRQAQRPVSRKPEPSAAVSPQRPKGDKPVQLAAASGKYALPPIKLLDFYDSEVAQPDPTFLEEKARVLEEKLADFGVQGQVVGISPGPVITMYEYAPAPGIKISRIVGLADDLSMGLKAESVRVVAPIPGKAAIGIEIPNEHRASVSLRSIIESKPFVSSTFPLTLALGKDITGQPVVTNLTRMPHLLIAGATGTGKSVCINAMLLSLLYRNTPETLRLLMIDPKRIELSSYEKIPHLLHPVVTEPKMATRALRWVVQEMELRYKLLADKNVRNIESYNRLMAKADPRKELHQGEASETANGTVLDHHHLPYIVVVIDELADLMMVASREVEEYITRLAQMARAAGIHLVLATQRPSVDVLTGIIKANIPTRISFQVSSKVDSRTILDTNGAESLLGSGDMLFLPPGTAKLQRIQGAFVSDTEVERITSFWKEQELDADPMAERVNFDDPEAGQDIPEDDLDEKYEEAVRLVVESRQASISMIQRRLRIGYNRAARMIEIMEQQGIVGPSDGSKPREVLVPREDFNT
ncbi:DNA translocase FtsK [Desulfacinum hydrothermale DSM 13146]|uniref:DNA translocase FtsK n=1 Tax=Desulfacinum hydrothermale DSM 13146 TaxID=1121390 RepID=A0A1W1XKK8_9BACT|nr:DNA translocase FtsK [Desulfacinum hydrothermale]SMC24509.1 DNA translocase FtsK [Desulfacinum hydrothermale DSM 13146]